MNATFPHWWLWFCCMLKASAITLQERKRERMEWNMIRLWQEVCGYGGWIQKWAIWKNNHMIEHHRMSHCSLKMFLTRNRKSPETFRLQAKQLIESTLLISTPLSDNPEDTRMHTQRSDRTEFLISCVCACLNTEQRCCALLGHSLLFKMYFVHSIHVRQASLYFIWPNTVSLDISNCTVPLRKEFKKKKSSI